MQSLTVLLENINVEEETVAGLSKYVQMHFLTEFDSKTLLEIVSFKINYFYCRSIITKTNN